MIMQLEHISKSFGGRQLFHVAVVVLLHDLGAGVLRVLEPDVVEPMKARLEELSVQLHLKTAVNGLVMKNGRVIGAYADGGEGVVRYSAKAVVLATGGFGGNVP